MGLSTPVSQCLVTPPYLAAAGVTWIEAYYADQWRVRSPFILGNCVAVGVGMLIFFSFPFRFVIVLDLLTEFFFTCIRSLPHRLRGKRRSEIFWCIFGGHSFDCEWTLYFDVAGE